MSPHLTYTSHYYNSNKIHKKKFSAQMAIAAEFAAKRLYSCPVKIEWLTKPPSNYKLSKATANPTYTSSQNVHFEEFQENVLSRCEKC